MRTLTDDELIAAAGGMLDQSEDSDGDNGSMGFGVLDEVRITARRKRRTEFLGKVFDSWDKFFDPTYLACPNTQYEMVATDMQGDEVVVEAKKIKADQVRDPGMLFPQWTGDGWTGWSDMKQSWGDLFETMSAGNLEAIRQALAEMLQTAMELNNSIAAGQICALVNLIVKAMTGEGDRGALGSSFGEGLFNVNGKTGVSLLPISNAFEGR